MFKKLPIFSGFGSNRKKNLSSPKLITEIAIRLKDQQTRLEESMHRLKERDKELFEKVVKAQIEGDAARATIYAQEISDIRKMIKIIYTAVLAIEKVRLKLDTVQELQEVSLVLFPVAKILQEMKEQIKGIAPDVALALDSIASSVNSIAIETRTINEKSVVPASIDEEAKKILEEAQRTAEIKIREILPDLPHPPSTIPLTVNKAKQESAQKRTLTEKELLEYINNTGGFLDIGYITKVYGVDKEEVFSLLKNMASKGLITLEE